MFERYTERAKRVIFFARYEAAQLGSSSIETEHLLLGLIREGKGLTSRIFAKSHLSMESIRKEIEGRIVIRDQVSTSVEIPLSAESKRVLTYAAEEAERLVHNYIGTEHILLGILREDKSVAASILHERGLRINTRTRRHCPGAQPEGDDVQGERNPASDRVQSRPDRSSEPRRARPAHRSRQRARADDPGAVPPNEEQSGAHRRARGRQDRHRRGARATRSCTETCRCFSPTSASSRSTSLSSSPARSTAVSSKSASRPS